MKRDTVLVIGDEVQIALDAGSGRNAKGVIALANEARFTAVNFSEPLTAYAIGWRDPTNLQEQLDLMFPPVEVPRRFEYKSAKNSDEFLSEADDVRAIGAAFKKVEYSGTSVNEKTLNKGLTVTLDRDEMVAGTEERTVARLIARLNRNDFRRGVALLAANATNTNKTWNSSADPDQDVADDLLTGGDARGVESNTLVYGPTAWSLRRKAYRAKTDTALVLDGSMTVDQVVQSLGLDKGLVSKARYQSTAAGKTRVVGSYVFMYYTDPVGSQEDPSNAKHFWTPTESGRFRVYREEHAKTLDISVEHYGTLACPSSLGMRMFTVS